jgi:hypothetical protein
VDWADFLVVVVCAANRLGAGLSTQLNPAARILGGGTGAGFFSYSFALPASAVPQLRPAGARGIRYTGRSVGAVSCQQEAWC